ncbi:MAG: TolC family protein [Oligoflexales bacterium]|nr:TolC family protein [Oligoflexales bacterium]
MSLKALAMFSSNLRILLLLSLAPSLQAGELTFFEALRLAQDLTPELRADEGRKRGESLRLEAERVSTYLPNLNIQRSQSSRSFGEQEQFSLNGNVNLFKFGGDSAKLRQSSLEEKKIEESRRDFLLQLEGSLARKFLKWISQSLSFQHKKKLRALTEERGKLTKARYERGLISFMELERAESDLLQDEINLEKESFDLESAKIDIRSLLGENSLQAEWPWSRQSLADQLLKLSSIPLKNHPRLLKLQYERSSKGEEMTVIKSAAAPSLSSSWSLPLNSKLNEGEIRISLDVPISPWASLRPRQESVLADQQSLEDSYRVEEKNLRETLDKSVLKLKQGLLILDRSKLLYEKIKALYTQNLQRFEKGMLSSEGLYQDELRLRAAEGTLLQVLYDLQLVMVELSETSGLRLLP